MKIAVFHPFLDNIGGAEMVALHLTRGLSADLYTTNIDQTKIDKMGFADIKPRSIGRVSSRPPWRQQAALTRFRYLNLSGQYDFFIIAGDWAVSATINHRPNLYYIHTPIRELWDLFESVRMEMVTLPARPIFDLWVAVNRRLNRKYIAAAEKIVCNSITTNKRLNYYLGRSGLIINPPIEIDRFYYRQNGDFWLSVNRLINHKRIEWQLAALARQPEEKLIIVGSYEQAPHFQRYARQLKQNCPPNVEIKSWVDQMELLKLYADCKGLLATAEAEDFGLTPVEAMAAGKPVIAPAAAGYCETIIDGQTGRLITNFNVDKLVMAMQMVGAEPEKYYQACRRRAADFAVDKFISRIKQEIDR